MKIKKLCKQCGQKFLIYLSHTKRGRGKFCSLECCNKNKIGKNIGENNCLWLGEKVGYFGIHKWLARIYGKANKCENINCLKRSTNFQWAKIKDKSYTRKRENFWMLCFGCHKRYDFNEKVRENLKKSHKGQIPWNKKS